MTATLDDRRLVDLIEAHKAFCVAHTPQGSGHAVTAPAAAASGIDYWLALRGGTAVGCIGMKALTAEHGEVKTLHVLDHGRGAGTGQLLVERVLNAARRRGFTRLSLETGRSEGFAASRRLYARLGFAACAPFGPYIDDPFSYCMTRTLAG